MMEQIYLGNEVARDSFVAATWLAGKATASWYHNNQRGITRFLKVLPSQTWCIMEVTGVYRHAVG